MITFLHIFALIVSIFTTTASYTMDIEQEVITPPVFTTVIDGKEIEVCRLKDDETGSILFCTSTV